MSNLSFARIMYGSNENLPASTWASSSPALNRLPGGKNPAKAHLESLVHKVLHAVLPGRF